MSQKVLVVEDDNNIAELLRLYLQKDGFEVSDRKSTRLNSSHTDSSRMPSSA